MQARINKREIDYEGQQLWLNTVDKTVYATDGAPTYSFGEVNGTPIYNYLRSLYLNLTYLSYYLTALFIFICIPEFYFIIIQGT